MQENVEHYLYFMKIFRISDGHLLLSKQETCRINQAKGNEMASHYHKLHLLSEGIPIFVLKISFSLTECSVALINWKANETS